MATRVTLHTVDDHLVVDKLALEGDRGDRKAEAAWLARARSQIVVRLLSSDDKQIRTLHGGQTTLRTTSDSPQIVAQHLLRLARGLADLHDRELVHGKLTPDHIIIDGEKVLLCSPLGTETDPLVDLRAIGTIVHGLLDRWEKSGVAIPRREEWARVVARLDGADERTTAQRVARWFAPLVISAPPARDGREDKRRAGVTIGSEFTDRYGSKGRGLAVLSLFLCATIGTTAWRSLTDSATESQPAGPVVIVEGQAFAVSTEGKTATPDGSCPPVVAHLDARATVWLFDVEDGEPGEATAFIPGATAIEFIDCALWASGPAGRTEVDLSVDTSGQ